MVHDGEFAERGAGTGLDDRGEAVERRVVRAVAARVRVEPVAAGRFGDERAEKAVRGELSGVTATVDDLRAFAGQRVEVVLIGVRPAGRHHDAARVVADRLPAGAACGVVGHARDIGGNRRHTTGLGGDERVPEAGTGLRGLGELVRQCDGHALAQPCAEHQRLDRVLAKAVRDLRAGCRVGARCGGLLECRLLRADRVQVVGEDIHEAEWVVVAEPVDGDVHVDGVDGVRPLRCRGATGRGGVVR